MDCSMTTIRYLKIIRIIPSITCATSRCFLGQFNMESELMQDQNLRKAVEMGIDKEGFCSVIMQGRGVPAKAAFPSSFLWK